MSYEPINFSKKFSLFDEQWQSQGHRRNERLPVQDREASGRLYLARS